MLKKRERWVVKGEIEESSERDRQTDRQKGGQGWVKEEGGGREYRERWVGTMKEERGEKERKGVGSSER